MLVRAVVILVAGLMPACLFFWWAFQGAKMSLLPSWESPLEDKDRPILNATLFSLFGIVHSMLAEVGIPRVAYMIVAGFTALGVMMCWQATDWVPIWQLGSDNLAWWYGAAQFTCWLSLHTWIICQLGFVEFFGFRYSVPVLSTTGPYAIVRHPMHASILFNLLATPLMTVDRLTLLASIVLYLWCGIQVEERRLEETYGEDWREYAARVPMLIPNWPGRVQG